MKFGSSLSRTMGILLLLAVLLLVFKWRSELPGPSRSVAVSEQAGEKPQVGDVESEHALRPITMDELSKLVARYPEDFTVAREDPEELQQYLKQKREEARQRDYRISNTQGLTAQLLRLLAEHHKDGSDATPSIVEALCLRRDLTAADIAPICTEMKRIMAKRVDVADFHTNIYLGQTVRLLEKFPSQENERIALQVLSLRPDLFFSQTKFYAAKVLQAYGSEQSLQPLLDMQAVLKGLVRDNREEYEHSGLPQIEEAIKAVRARSKQ